MANYTVDYAPLSDTVVLRWEGEGEATEIVLPYSKREPEKSEKKRQEFIDNLTLDDQVFLEVGSGADKFALAAYRQGASVFRLPGWIIIQERQEGDLGKNQTAPILREIAIETPDQFYPYEELDERIAEVLFLGRAYRTIQNDIRKPGVQRLEAVSRDMYLVRPLGMVDVQVFVQKDLLERVFGPILIARRPPKTKKKKKEKEPLAEVFEQVFKELEAGVYSLIEKALPKVPVWRGVFQKIPGCGPSIASRLIGEIKDIRYFPDRAHLRAYAGYHHFEDGKRARRIRGQVSNWNPELKQAVWSFTAQIRQYGQQKTNPWRKAYDARLTYEEGRQEDFNGRPKGERSFPPDRAMRWLGQKLLDHIWSRWRVFNAGGDYKPPDFQYLRD